LIQTPLLLGRNHAPFATGGTRYIENRREITGTEARILVPLSLEAISQTLFAVVDTAAPWCIFEPEVGSLLRQCLSPSQEHAVLSSRFGTLRGSLYRVPIALIAEEGESLDVEATVFLSPDWPGPNFIGYQGLLQRIRFAVDPETNLFYFGSI
jgi:hypothetical protein